MLKHLDELLGPALETVTCERGHRMLHGEPECLRCPEPPKPGVHPEDAKPGILNEDKWLRGARHRLNEEAKAHPVDHEHGQCRFGDGCYAKIEPKEGELTELEAIVERAVQHMQTKEQAKIRERGKPDPKRAKLWDGCRGYQTPHDRDSVAYQLVPDPGSEPERKPRNRSRRSKRFLWMRSR